MENTTFKIRKGNEDIGTIEVTDKGLRLIGDQQRLETIVSPMYTLSGVKNLRIENGGFVRDEKGKVVQDGTLEIKPGNSNAISSVVRCYLKEVLSGVVEAEETPKTAS